LFTVLNALVGPEDEVIIPDPMYVTYPDTVFVAGATPVPVATDPDGGFHVDADRIAAAVGPHSRAILLTSPNNPTGAVIPAETLRRIIDIAVAHDLWILSDEVYITLGFGEAPVSLACFGDAADRCVVLGSLSK